MKGITVVKAQDSDSGKLYFVLNDNKDWEIFLSICNDLINMATKCPDEIRMIPIINQRIRRWQKFLSENHTASMSEILQMGLFAELYCMLHSLIPVFGYKESVLCWVGPDADKKDFSLLEFFIEVKSFISSKDRIVKISSAKQLDNEGKPLFLTVYGLTKINNGLSIVDLANSIDQVIPNEDYDTREILENKLAAYGYIQNITEAPFYNYSIDLNKSYLVSDEFPKIVSCNIDSRILSVTYSLDLNRCVPFEAPLPFL